MARNNDEEARRYGARESEHPDDPIDESTRLQTHLLEDFSEDSSPPTPRFIQDQGSYRSMKWVPIPIRRVTKAAMKWAKGPDPPHTYSIKPLFPIIQEAPTRLLDEYVPKFRHRLLLVTGYYFLWILTFALIMRRGTVATEIEGWGTPGNIGCGNTYWVPGNSCGLNGNDCRPFNGSGFPFRCPANCQNYWVLNPRAVGAYEAIYQPLVIGGPSEDGGRPTYRGDSFICGAAIHAGIIDNENGGCGVVSLVGSFRNYTSSKQHGIESIAFDSKFPSSFTFHSAARCEAKDARWELLYVSLAFTIVFSLFVTSPALYFFTIFTATFFHAGLASDPPLTGSPIAELMSNLLGKYLPSMFIAFVMYKYMGVRRALIGLTAQIEKTILWLGGCWVGTLTNYTFDWIPIQRLNKHDLEQQPGAKLALAIIVILLAIIFIKQIFYFQREARLIRYLGIYGILVGAILISLLLPGLNLRIHHYILALLLLPGTSMQTRPALFYQGLLIGFYVNGIARWGFDPVLQTSAALQGDAQHNSRLPIIQSPNITLGEKLSTISFSWLPPPDPFDGLSVLVNDVERFRGYTDEGLPTDNRFVWSKRTEIAEPQYFRFSYMQGRQSWDYTHAGIWNANGSWTEMKPGPSRIKSRSLDDEALLQ
ncbi:hypothetical protein B0O99DRAFT_234110 [Bisporella sp. PMI_857]|nr:hypothetical protein B0O99DRAFT_234110 [Bisporella sp. PMI_857]